MTAMTINSYEDVIDVRDVIDEYEGIREDADEQDRANELATLLADLRGYGGDHQWEGAWYPVTLIRDSYFITYAQELADEIGAINSEMRWPATCIDWDQAARELQIDYTSVEYNGTIYWYR